MTNRQKFKEIFGYEIALKDTEEAVPGHRRILISSSSHFDKWLDEQYIDDDEYKMKLQEYVKKEDVINELMKEREDTSLFEDPDTSHDYALGHDDGICVSAKIVLDMDRASIHPIVFGRWQHHYLGPEPNDVDLNSLFCSKCGFYVNTSTVYDFSNYNFCPKCGAVLRRDNLGI